jgi:tetratricopeptide (TPR) repeat protein
MRLAFALLLSLLLPAAANAAWRQASTPHFVVYSEESADDLRAFATRLERFDQAMRKMRGIPDPPLGPSNRLTVYVVSDVTSVQRLMGGSSRNLAGFYIPRAGGSIAVVPRRAGNGGAYDMSAEEVLLHEYTHHLMFYEYAGAAFPAWYVEGFAEFNGSVEFGRDGSIGFGMPALHRARGLSGGMSVERVLTSSADLKNLLDTERFYARSWLLTHYLTFEPSRKGQLSAYLRALNGGQNNLAAARQIFGDLKKLDGELDRYIRRARLPYLKFEASELRIGEISVRDLTPAQDAMMELRIRSDSGVNRETAKPLLARMRKAAAAYPKDSAAQAYLAEAEYDAGNYTEAAAAADRALTSDPRNVDALLYKGRALIAAANAEKKPDSPAWKEARSWFVKANKIDLEHPEPLTFYYQTFVAGGSKPPASAVAGLLKAHDLAPQDRSLRMMVVRQHLADRNIAEAKAALAPVAYDPHGGPMSKMASTLLAMLTGPNANAALEFLEKDSIETGRN